MIRITKHISPKDLYQIFEIFFTQSDFQGSTSISTIKYVSGKTTLVAIPAYLDIGFAHSLMRMDIFSAVPLIANVIPEFLGHMMTVPGQTGYDVSLDQKVHSVYPQSNAFSICMEMICV